MYGYLSDSAVAEAEARQAEHARRFPHTPPAATEWDEYARSNGTVPGNAFAVGLIPDRCGRCAERTPVVQIGWSLSSPEGIPITTYHRTAEPCPACRFRAAMDSVVPIPIGIIRANVEVPNPKLDPGMVYASIGFLRHPKFGHECMYRLLSRHVQGDLGDVGLAEPTDRDRAAGPLTSQPKRNYISMELGTGLVLAGHRIRQDPYNRQLDLYVYVATLLDPVRGNQTVVSDRPI